MKIVFFYTEIVINTDPTDTWALIILLIGLRATRARFEDPKYFRKKKAFKSERSWNFILMTCDALKEKEFNDDENIIGLTSLSMIIYCGPPHEIFFSVFWNYLLDFIKDFFEYFFLLWQIRRYFRTYDSFLALWCTVN